MEFKEFLKEQKSYLEIVAKNVFVSQMEISCRFHEQDRFILALGDWAVKRYSVLSERVREFRKRKKLGGKLKHHVIRKGYDASFYQNIAVACLGIEEFRKRLSLLKQSDKEGSK